jgi:saccharopine dehydrogenase-like NADP-dependent oxidoreductase
VDGLINEYCHPCEAIHGGEFIEVLPLEGLEHFSLDGTEYEAFNTSRRPGHAVRDAGRQGAQTSTTRPCATPATAT